LGDVIGAHLEFDKDVNQTKIKDAFMIKGGGKHKLEPGQPTDDSELNYAILKGLERGK
jgi:ADP-ribosylglycohydrolase